jgi:glucan endo-1,3-alpha-glucosidase
MYAGAQYANECYCSNTISTANGGGQVHPLSECDMPCAGDSTQKCGASYRLTLYTKTPPASGVPAGWHKNFCSVDQASSRVLTGSITGNIGNMTPASCIAMCDGQGYGLAGVENGNECHCGNTVNYMLGVRDVECGGGRAIGGNGQGVACTGDNTQGCGGSWRIMVYQKDASTPTGSNAWTLENAGTSGVVMTHVAVVNADTVLVIDRKENNPLLNREGDPAWGAVWSLTTRTSRALNIETHSFCSAGSFLSNGTLANFGGHPYTYRNGQAAPEVQQVVRMFTG